MQSFVLRDGSGGHLKRQSIASAGAATQQQEVAIAIPGVAEVRTDFATRLVYARDRSPFAAFQVRSGMLPAALPCGVAFPSSHDEVVAVLAWAARSGTAVVPYGAGSGVLGGAVPLGGELVVDMKRLNRLLALDAFNGTVTVEAGMNGGQFEALLNERGYTGGHLPQSIHMSTVGGWVACRGAGQNSARFGKIEDIVLGMKVVLPDGRTFATRPLSHRAAGPGLRELFVGSEGALGLITEVTLRIWRRPEAEVGCVFAFPGLAAGLAAAREVMQAELRPAVLRLYDQAESAERTRDLPEFGERPILCMMTFSGLAELAAVEARLATGIAARHGAVVASDAPLRHWRQTRFDTYSAKWQAADSYMDTVEVVAPWSAIEAMYAALRAAVFAIHPGMHFGTHWSHAYPEAVCQYMTMRLPPMPDAQALPLHGRLWDAATRICLEHGGSISHHHGVGAFRGPWMRAELGAGFEVLQAVKDALDPANLLNPGKLGLRPRAGSLALAHAPASGARS